VHPHGIALPRGVVDRMAIEATRAVGSPAGFLEHRHGALSLSAIDRSSDTGASVSAARDPACATKSRVNASRIGS